MNIDRDTTELMKYFRVWNYVFFENQLEEPVITIQSSCKRYTNGWFTPAKTWQTKDGQKKYNEIAIVAERLNRSHEDIAETILHEMIHYYNNVAQINDTNGLVHNKNFKKTAEQHGLEVVKDKKLGWAITKLNPKAKEIFETFTVDEGAFTTYRIPMPERQPKEKKPSFKYVCPGCKHKFTLKVEIEATCIECGTDYEVDEKDAD